MWHEIHFTSETLRLCHAVPWEWWRPIPKKKQLLLSNTQIFHQPTFWPKKRTTEALGHHLNWLLPWNMFFSSCLKWPKKTSYKIQPLTFLTSQVPPNLYVLVAYMFSRPKCPYGKKSGCQTKECKKLVIFCSGKSLNHFEPYGHAMWHDVTGACHPLSQGANAARKVASNIAENIFQNHATGKTCSQPPLGWGHIRNANIFLCWLQKEQVDIDRLH